MSRRNVIEKAEKPPKGFVPVPGSRRGGWRKKVGGKWVYWYPGDTLAKVEEWLAEKKEKNVNARSGVPTDLRALLGPTEGAGSAYRPTAVSPEAWAEVFGTDSSAWVEKVLEVQAGWEDTAELDVPLGDYDGNEIGQLEVGGPWRSVDYDASFTVIQYGKTYTVRKELPDGTVAHADNVPRSTLQALMSRWRGPGSSFEPVEDAHGAAWYSELLLFTGPAGVEQVVKAPMFIRMHTADAKAKVKKLKAVSKLADQAAAVATVAVAPLVNPKSPKSVKPADVLVAASAKDADPGVIAAADKIAAAQAVGAEAQAILKKLEKYAGALQNIRKGMWSASREAVRAHDKGKKSSHSFFENQSYGVKQYIIFKAELDFLRSAEGRKLLAVTNLTGKDYSKDFKAFGSSGSGGVPVYTPPPFVPPPPPTFNMKKPAPPGASSGEVPPSEVRKVIDSLENMLPSSIRSKAVWYVGRLIGAAGGKAGEAHAPKVSFDTPEASEKAVRYLSTPGFLDVPFRLPEVTLSTGEKLIGPDIDGDKIAVDGWAEQLLAGMAGGRHNKENAADLFRYNRLHHIDDVRAAIVVANSAAAVSSGERRTQWEAIKDRLLKFQAGVGKKKAYAPPPPEGYPMEKAAKQLAGLIKAAKATVTPEATAAYDKGVAEYKAAYKAYLDAVVAYNTKTVPEAKAEHQAKVDKEAAEFAAKQGAAKGAVPSDLGWGSKGLDQLRSAVAELRAKSPESILHKTIVAPDGGRLIADDFGIPDFTPEYKQELVKAARALATVPQGWRQQYAPKSINKPFTGSEQRKAYKQLALKAGVSERAMLEVTSATGALTAGHVVGVHSPDIAAERMVRAEYTRAHATLMTVATYQGPQGKSLSPLPPVLWRSLQMSKDTLAAMTAGLTLTLEVPSSFSRREFQGGVNKAAETDPGNMASVVYVIRDPKQGFNVEKVSTYDEAETIMAGSFGVEEVYSGPRDKHPELTSLPGASTGGANKTYVFLRQLEQDEKAVLGLEKGGPVPQQISPKAQARLSAELTISMAMDTLRRGDGVPVFAPGSPEPEDIFADEDDEVVGTVAKGGWSSKRARDASRRLAEFEAMKVRGTVITLPEPIALPPVGERVQTLLKSWKRLGLDKTEADAQVQHLLRSNDFRKAVAVMENMIEAMNPPRGFVPFGPVHGAFVKVRNGEAVQYWKAGKLMTPAVFGEAFLGEFNPDATIKTSAVEGNDVTGDHLTPEDPLGDEVDTSVVAEAETRESRPVTRDTREVGVLDGTLLGDMFSVNGGGGYNY